LENHWNHYNKEEKKMKHLKSQLTVLFSIILLMMIISSCQSDQKHTESEESENEREEHSEIVKLHQEELEEFGIELVPAGPGKLNVHVFLPGEIIIPPDNLAHIHPRFPGIVKKVYKNIGDYVKKGETLAIIEGNESLTEYEIKSLIRGTVVEKHISLGEVVENSEHGFVIADLSNVWAILELYQKDLPYVRIGQKVTIKAGPGIPDSKGKITYISPIIDEKTRTAEVRVVLNNPKGYWKPGLFVNGQITTSDVNVALLVPKTAIEYYEDKKVVFVQTDEGFEPRAVSIGRTNEIAVEVTGGIRPGETYVSKGGFTLKAELQKSELGDDDEH
jgi:cobalt-zinc-cadmium efflux system membrane fusion protein